ncbi:SYF2 splicing factor [Malassezia vespertilionis]|uniref:SYF2 splicing factor n=1 Tax=Malassezia vespertilionis TaxID=2020962 RepID=UPI0024B25445|nr:SYF2 splicing factor [Malassezia vespertilionis]WFD08455.1 SYF2 splicing factor [Malassezia vespertilionis]
MAQRDAALASRAERLNKLRNKMSESASANRSDVVAEQSTRREKAQKRSTAYARKLAKAERVLEERDMQEAGEDVERNRAMQYSIEENEVWEKKLAGKEERRDKGALDFQDLAERAYQRQIKLLKPDIQAYAKEEEAEHERPAASFVTQRDLVPASEAQVPAAVATYGKHAPDMAAVDRLVSHLNHEQDQIRRRSRRRDDDTDTNVTYINEKNKHFNKKIKRYFDEYTQEIRDNLERGTAIHIDALCLLLGRTDTARKRPPGGGQGGGASLLATMVRAAANIAARRAEPQIVLDLGSRVCRAGFSGDAFPRAFLDARELGAKALGREIEALWTLDWMQAAHDRTLQERHRDLRLCLEYLFADAQATRVLVAHSPLLMEAVRQLFCDVLIGNLGAPRVSFIDTHTLALLATGRMTGLVVDCGYWETVVLPIYAGRPLFECIATTPRAAHRLATCTAALLGQEMPAALLERCVTESLVVSAMPTSQFASTLPLDTEAFAAAYKAQASAPDFALRTKTGTLHVPGWIRERAAEVLFDAGDEDETNVVACTLQSIARLPLDTRREILDA